MDPHKRSATIEIIDDRETVLAGGRFGTHPDGYPGGPAPALSNRTHKLLRELLPGGAKPSLPAAQARALLATIRPRDLVGRTRRRMASQLIAELVGIDKKIKAAKKELTDLVKATGSSLQDLNGIGPSRAARPIGDIGDIRRLTR